MGTPRVRAASSRPSAGTPARVLGRLRGVPMIAVRPGYGVRRRVDALAAKAGVELQSANKVAFLSSALWMTSSGLGVSIWPQALLRDAFYDNLVACPLVAPVAYPQHLAGDPPRALAVAGLRGLRADAARRSGVQLSVPAGFERRRCAARGCSVPVRPIPDRVSIRR